MNTYHEVLLHQIEQLKIDLLKEPKDSPLLKLLSEVSKTYLDNDERCSILEQNNDLATEKLNLINKQYETELNKMNAVSYDGILITDTDWNVSSINHHAEKILHVKATDYLGIAISKKLMFLNAQKDHLDLTKLKYHFECGNNYICKQGVIVNLDGQGYEIFASFTIAPFYLNDVLNSYVIIFRDITQDIIKECNITLNNLNNLASIKNKEKAFLSSAQEVISNNHNGALASELQHHVGHKTSQLIEQYIVNHAIRSNILSLNQILDNSSQFDKEQHSFLIENKLSEIRRGIAEIGLPQDIPIENKVYQLILGDDSQFEQLVYEIIGLTRTTFKSSNITHLSFIPLKIASTFRPWISVQLTLHTAFSISNELIQTNIGQIKETLTSQFFDSIVIDNSNHTIKVQIILKFPLMKEEFISTTYQTTPMRCLFYLEDNSPLMSQMKSSYLINQLNYYEAKTAEDAVQKIKEGRLNKTEFNIIISDKKDLEQLERSVFHEITSYINDHFLGLIYISDNPSGHFNNLDIKVYSIPNNPGVKELRSILYSLRALYLKQSRLIATPTGQLPVFDKRILFLDFEDYSQILYLQLFEELGLNVCISNPHQLDPGVFSDSFDGILINAHNDMTALISLLKEINSQGIEAPICVFVPPIPDDDLSDILSYKVEHYLIKPFSISEFLIMLEHGFRK